MVALVEVVAVFQLTRRNWRKPRELVIYDAYKLFPSPVRPTGKEKSCGGGISKQQRRCRRKPCKGRPWSTKYKVCNSQNRERTKISKYLTNTQGNLTNEFQENTSFNEILFIYARIHKSGNKIEVLTESRLSSIVVVVVVVVCYQGEPPPPSPPLTLILTPVSTPVKPAPPAAAATTRAGNSWFVQTTKRS
ncbi:hypothetical protein M0804_002280 [Polistes exclamans]|nr:hypothetical protein M0804_002280 [Polistes exclamans]